MAGYAFSFAPAIPVKGLRREIDRIFDDVLQMPLTSNWQPRVDVRESPSELIFEFDVPGATPDSLEVDILENTLSIRGRREQTTVKEDEKRVVSERISGSFERKFRLPKDVDPNSVTAHYNHGVLTIHVMKVAPVEPRKVTVSVEGAPTNGKN